MLDRFPQPPGVGEGETGIVRNGGLNLLVLLARSRLNRFESHSTEAGNIHPLLLQSYPAGVAGREIENVVDPLGQAINGFEDGAHVIARLGAELAGVTPAQQLGGINRSRMGKSCISPVSEIS